LFTDWGGSSLSSPAGTPWALAGTTGAADTSAMRATDPESTSVFWKNFDMMISLSVDAPPRAQVGKQNNTGVLAIKVTSHIEIKATTPSFWLQRTSSNMTGQLILSTAFKITFTSTAL
jgi:hypothetical protein